MMKDEKELKKNMHTTKKLDEKTHFTWRKILSKKK